MTLPCTKINFQTLPSKVHWVLFDIIISDSIIFYTLCINCKIYFDKMLQIVCIYVDLVYINMYSTYLYGECLYFWG